jgi:hypothetical protein
MSQIEILDKRITAHTHADGSDEFFLTVKYNDKKHVFSERLLFNNTKPKCERYILADTANLEAKHAQYLKEFFNDINTGIAYIKKELTTIEK